MSARNTDIEYIDAVLYVIGARLEKLNNTFINKGLNADIEVLIDRLKESRTKLNTLKDE